ncbi:hypothetical protein U1Q18_028303 [Sarracenia purpurea var. burkii]
MFVSCRHSNRHWELTQLGEFLVPFGLVGIPSHDLTVRSQAEAKPRGPEAPPGAEYCGSHSLRMSCSGIEPSWSSLSGSFPYLPGLFPLLALLPQTRRWHQNHATPLNLTRSRGLNIGSDKHSERPV